LERNNGPILPEFLPKFKQEHCVLNVSASNSDMELY